MIDGAPLHPLRIAVEARDQVSAAIGERVAAGKTIKLGPWSGAGRSQLRRAVHQYIKSPVGAAAKYLDGVKLKEVRPFNDHTRVGTNGATDMTFLGHTLDTIVRVSKGFMKDFYMRVADVSGAFTLLPLSDKVRQNFPLLVLGVGRRRLGDALRAYVR